jgi:hypothetical protein
MPIKKTPKIPKTPTNIPNIPNKKPNNFKPVIILFITALILASIVPYIKQ